jgi:hypothetical protein
LFSLVDESIKQVNWIMPPNFWMKCNTNGAPKDLQISLHCGGIFRDYLGTFLGTFSANTDVATSLYAEICTGIYVLNLHMIEDGPIFGLNVTPFS